jgi:receptor protein-tyrosine kinase
VLLKTNIPKLSLLPAGQRNPIATELLASDAMDRWLAEVATRYEDRVVIFDGPPLLLTTEARVLASRVGQVMVVVDSSSTSMGKVSEAFATIENCPQVMSVLNKCPRQERTGGYYGYGY